MLVIFLPEDIFTPDWHIINITIRRVYIICISETKSRSQKRSSLCMCYVLLWQFFNQSFNTKYKIQGALYFKNELCCLSLHKYNLSKAVPCFYQLRPVWTACYVVGLEI